MYSRKIKLSKKKSKNNNGKSTPGGSSWGPRIALYEREKAHRTLTQTQSSGLNQSSNPCASSSSSTVPSSAPPSSNNGNYDYNYSRSSVTTSSSSQVSGHIPQTQQNLRLLTTNQIKRRPSRNNSVVSGTSSNSNSNSVSTKTASLAANLKGSNTYISTNDVLTKPLTLIIPPPDRFGYGFEGFGYKCDDSLPSTHTYRSSGAEEIPSPSSPIENTNEVVQNDIHNGDSIKRTVVRVDQHEIPSSHCKSHSNSDSETYGVSMHNDNKTHPPVKQPEFGILTVSTTESQVHLIPNDSPTETIDMDTSEPVTMNIDEINQDNGSGTYERYEEFDDYCNDGEREHQEITITQSQSDYATTGRLGHDAMAMAGGPSLKSKINGSTITALAQGITMVYVPMESLPRNSNVATKDTKKLTIPSSSSSSIANGNYGSTKNTISKSQSNSLLLQASSSGGSNNNNKTNGNENDDADSIETDLANNLLAMEIKDPDGDSLLESFDSIIFKPKSSGGSPNSASTLSEPSPHFPPPPPIPCSSSETTPAVPPTPIPTLSTFVANTSTTNGGSVHSDHTNNDQAPKRKPPPPIPPPKIIRNQATPSNIYGKPKQMISETPPPLPPKNGIYSNVPVETDKQKSLRFALASLETLNNGTYDSTHSQISGHYEYHGYCKGGNGKKVKKVTLTLPGEDLAREHELIINYDDVNKYSCSTILSCGHYKNDNYSTLSSINSAQISDVDDGEEHYQDTGTFGEDNLLNPQIDSRSALQQLRDLSLLIGGNFHCATIDEDFRFPPLIDKKLKNGKSRRDSDATDNSADSGKGSGSGRTPTESSPQGDASNSSPNSSSSSGSNVKCSCGNTACVFRPDCTECLLFNRTQPFEKPDSSEELCSNSNDEGSGKIRVRSNGHTHSHSVNANYLRKQTKLKRTNSRPLVTSSTRSARPKPKKSVILDYCECKNCGNHKPHSVVTSAKSRTNNVCDVIRYKPESPPSRQSVSLSKSSNSKVSKLAKTALISRNMNRRSTATLSQVTAASLDPNFLFTIAEDEEIPNATITGSKSSNSATNTTTITSITPNPQLHVNPNSFFLDVQLGHNARNGHRAHEGNNNSHISNNNKVGHWHPQCWLATDATMGWSDLESLYSQNMKSDKPIAINDECWTCWKELSEHKHNSTDPNRTVDRTKRMFIWLNRRHKEFHAPWWEAKKQASIRWLVTKAFAHLPKAVIEDPFKESKKGKPSKYRLRDEVIKGLVNCKLYCMSLDNLYQSSQQQYHSHSKQGLTHWDIIKILSRRGVYVASPSDMKLTEGTLRQRKPIRIAAHIALIEAIMGLYAKEILGRERILATLKSFGRNVNVDPDTSTSEQLVIAWINAAMYTLKSYIISKKNQKLPSARIHRWLHVPQIDEIRDLCDGVGICSLFALYCSNDIKVSEIAVPEPGDPLTIYDSISNHTLVQKLCEDLFPEPIYHLCVTDFLYIHGYMKQNILCFLVDLFNHLEINPAIRVNRLTHVPIRIEL